jgi:hypothetical protein
VQHPEKGEEMIDSWSQAQPAPKEMIRMLSVNFPQVRNLGIYSCRNVEGTSKKSAHAEGRALGDQLFLLIIKTAYQAGIDNVIWNRQIWSILKGGPRPFIGSYPHGGPRNPHTNDIYIEWTRGGSRLRQLQYLELQIAILRGGRSSSEPARICLVA